MPYILRRVKDGYKVCKKSDPSTCFSKKGLPESRAKKQMAAIIINEKSGGRKHKTLAESRAEEERKLEEFKQKNKAAKEKEKARNVKESRVATLSKLVKELKNKRKDLEAQIDPDFRDNVIAAYNDDIQKIQEYRFRWINNERLKRALIDQQWTMLQNMGNNPKKFGSIPDWVADNPYTPEATKYVYEHYGQAEPDWTDTLYDWTMSAVSNVAPLIAPGLGSLLVPVLDTAKNLATNAVLDYMGLGEKALGEVDVAGILEGDATAQIEDYNAREEAAMKGLEELEAQDKPLEEELQLLTSELNPQQIAQQAQEIKEGSGKPKNKKLYDQIVAKVKKEQPKHSLFRSARIQKEYQAAGGTYVGDKPGDKKGLKGWFNSKWISLNDYAHDGEIVPCGSARTEEHYGEYPLCRPLEVAKKIGRTKALKMLKVKDDLKEQPLFTEKVLGTKKYNVKPHMAGGLLEGDAKPLTARLGGKVLLKKTIVDKFFPPSDSYDTYVEPFVGGGSVYFYKEKDGHKEVVNDLDPLIYTIFKGFQKFPGEKIANAVNGDYTTDDFVEIAGSKPKGEFQRFIKAFLLNRISYFAKSKAYGKPRINSSFEGYQERLKDATILKKDWVKVVNKYNVGNKTFFYLDPPMAKSDSTFEYDPVDFKQLKRAVDAIDDQGNKFLLTITERPEMFKAYNIKKVKANIVGDRKKGGQTIPIDHYLITNYNVGSSGSGKFGKSNEQKQLEKGEKSSNEFMKQLEKLNISPDDYMTVAKFLAKKKGYDPDLLSFASDGEHKLIYDSPEGIRKFGRVGYGDYIIWSYLERMGKVPEGTADKKRNTFHKSHKAMSKEYGLKKYSPNELALNINW